MRILISTGIFPNAVDPSRGIYIYKQAMELSARCDVRVIAPIARYLPPFGRLGRNADGIPHETEMDGLHILHPRYSLLPRLRGTNGLMLAAGVRRVFRRVAHEFQPDVILSFFAYPDGVASAMLARSLGLPVAIGCLGSDVNVKSKRAIEGLFIRRAFAQAGRVLTVSAALAREVEALGVSGDRLAIIPNGIDRDQFPAVTPVDARTRLGVEFGGRLIVCVSRLSREKGVDILLDAVPHLRDRDVRVLVVGDGDQRKELEARSARLGLAGRVTFVGRKAHDEVPLWISAGQVVALPSRIEGHPNAVLEAHACGRPVVAANVGGVPETITSERVGVIVDPEDPHALARGLDAALETNWSASEIAAFGQRRTWGDVADEVLRELEAIRVHPRKETVTSEAAR